jgi:hypothetical protein
MLSLSLDDNRNNDNGHRKEENEKRGRKPMKKEVSRRILPNFSRNWTGSVTVDPTDFNRLNYGESTKKWRRTVPIPYHDLWSIAIMNAESGII